MDKVQVIFLIALLLGIQTVFPSDILQRQKRSWIIDSFKIEEEKEPFPYILGKINVEKNFLVLKLSGQGVDEDPKNLLQMNNKGVIQVLNKVDYEKYKVLKMTFEAYDDSKKKVDTRLGVEVEIMDVNDNPPVFGQEILKVDVQESDSHGDHYLISVAAHDEDNSNTKNGTFDLRIVSVTPKPIDLEFYLIQKDEVGTINYRGCLDHETADKYTILVEAKDQGEKVQLSSTCTVIVSILDGNNHLPIFTGQSGPGRVKEKEDNVAVLRLQVSDQDSTGTDAWRAIYQIHGDANKNFKIVTDPDTNDGVLYVEKPLDYEENVMTNLSVSVENKAPHYSCKVQKRSTSGPWDVVISHDIPPNTRQVTVHVEDVNDPPFFHNAVKTVMVEENVAVGHYLETFTAEDLDSSHSNQFVYRKGDDPGDWVAVDSKTCRITMTKILDRESPLVKDNIYKVTVYAVDNGEPPMTGTGTLNIHIKDQNDNTPKLASSNIDICASKEPSYANLTASDLDEEPYGGPFNFKLRGDHQGKWRVQPDYGHSVNLVRESSVFSGHYDLQIVVFDMQGQSSVHNLSVTVCKCDPTKPPNCRSREVISSGIGAGALGILFIAMLLPLGVLLLALFSCKNEYIFSPVEGSGDKLIKFNTEAPGSDCLFPLGSQEVDKKPAPEMQYKNNDSSIKTRRSVSRSKSMNPSHAYNSKYWGQSQVDGFFPRGNSAPWPARSQSFRNYTEFLRYQHSSTEVHQNETRDTLRRLTNVGWSQTEDAYAVSDKAILNVLCQRISTLQTPWEELGDYAPHQYADEGDPANEIQLDALSIAEIPFDSDMLLYLGPRFKTLASICQPVTNNF